MAFPMDSGQFVLDTDASYEAIGAIFSQVQNGVKRVTVYVSRPLDKPERSYCTTDSELLEVRYFIQYYK